MNYKKSYLVVLSIAALSLLSSCGSGDKQPQDNVADMQQIPPQETDFLQLTKSSADTSVGYPGAIEGHDNVDVKAQVTGYLDGIYIKEGQYVNKGQILFKIKGDVYNEQVNNSTAALKNAIANQANAKLEIDKLKPLVDGKVISDVQLKTAQANYAATTAQVAQARSAVGSAQITANFTIIKAPVSGFIGRIPNRLGNLITPADSSPLTTLSNISTVNVYFSMNEADYLSYQKSTTLEKAGKVELLLADGSTYNYTGSLQMASGNIDSSTGSIQMKAVFNNPDKLLRSGGTARVVIHRNMEGIIKLPKIAVKDIQDKYFVYKLGTKNTVNMVPVEVSGSSLNDYFVLSGLSVGDKIAINRIETLYEGAQVIAKVSTKVPASK